MFTFRNLIIINLTVQNILNRLDFILLFNITFLQVTYKRME